MSGGSQDDSGSHSGQSMVILQQQQQYAVQAIRSHKVIDNKTYFLVKWLDYSEAQNTWQPSENLTTVSKMVEEYLERRKKLFRKADSEEKRKKKSPKKNREVSSRQGESEEQERRRVGKVGRRQDKRVEKAEEGASGGGGREKEVMREKMVVRQARALESLSSSSQQPIRSSSADRHRPSQPTAAIAAPTTAHYFQPPTHTHSQPRPSPPPNQSTQSTSTQFPQDMSIIRINHLVIKNHQIYYEVQYAKGSNKLIVDLKHSSIVLQSNPTAIAEFYERSLLEAE